MFADKDAPGLSHYLGLGDVNGDGLTDAASAAKIPPDGNWFAWWEQPAAGSLPWKKHILATGQEGATNILMAEVNGDGLMDFIATRGHGKGVLWFEAPEFTLHEINPNFTGPHDLAVGDIDQDGDIDAVSCAKDDLRRLGSKTTAEAVSPRTSSTKIRPPTISASSTWTSTATSTC